MDVDGAFISQPAEIYKDQNWQLFDSDSVDIRFTGTLEACEAAARPDVDPEHQNYCVQCLPEYVSDTASVTYVIPMKPVAAASTTIEQPRDIMGGTGIAANGVRLDGPAPIDAILGAYTIAPFDDCGGHMNLHVGYHYHAATDCLVSAPTTISDAAPEAVAEHSGQIGLAMDGYAIFPHELASGAHPDALDACYGHETDNLSYHYHAGAAGSNQILGCLTVQQGCVLNEGQTECGATRRGPPPQ